MNPNHITLCERKKNTKQKAYASDNTQSFFVVGIYTRTRGMCDEYLKSYPLFN